LFAYNLPRRGIYTDIVLKIPAPYRGLPAGVLYKTASAGGDDSAQRSEVLFNEIYAYRGKYDTSFYDDFFNNRIIYYYAAGRNNLGLYYAGAGMMRHAEEHYEAALAMDPYLVEAWNNLGALYFNEKKYGKALARFEKAIALKPSDPALLYNAGLVAKNTGDREKTMDYFRRSLDAGYNPGAANEIGLLEIAAGNFDEASRVFGEIVSKYPGYSAARYNLGLALQKKGDSAGAAAAYEKYLPFSEDSRENAALRELISSLRKH
jgi:Tfp pilus assembly protein PilF